MAECDCSLQMVPPEVSGYNEEADPWLKQRMVMLPCGREVSWFDKIEWVGVSRVLIPVPALYFFTVEVSVKKLPLSSHFNLLIFSWEN